jgi:hypothetical protein
MLIKSIFHCWNYSSRILNMFFVISLVVGFSSCEKDSDEEEVKVTETGSVTDASGITYKTVKIGGQWWMAEDLKTTVYQRWFTNFSISGTWQHGQRIRKAIVFSKIILRHPDCCITGML